MSRTSDLNEVKVLQRSRSSFHEARSPSFGSQFPVLRIVEPGDLDNGSRLRENSCSLLPWNQADSGDSGIGSQADMSFTERVVKEIVESETVYVADLQQVVKGYIDFWNQQGNSNPMSVEQSTALFSNLQSIYHFNSQFLQQLHGCGLDPVAIARCFVINNSGFAIYSDYCTNYPRSVSVLTELLRNTETNLAFRKRQTELEHTLPLGSYLLKPVQRILKYHLLLGNLAKHYDGNPSGYTDVIVALSAMTAIAHHINDMKRKHEHAVRVQEIQSLLDGWQGRDLTTYGELIAEGSFRMHGAKNRRHIFLFDLMLLLCKKRDDGTLQYRTHIPCSNLMLIESVPGDPLSFHVIPFDNPRLQYTLEARNQEQKREWTLQLKRVILEHYDVEIPAHARQLVLQLGQESYQRKTSTDYACSRKQYSAPEYLERRRNSSADVKVSLKKTHVYDKPTPSDESPRSSWKFKTLEEFFRQGTRSQARRVSVSTQAAFPTKSGSTVNRSLSCPTRKIAPRWAATKDGPSSPSTWLQLQSNHLPKPAKKSGSLPRSFPSTNPEKDKLPERPITIASDSPTSVDLPIDLKSNIDFADIDRSDTDCSMTPRISEDNIYVHPDHKIYRRTGSRSSLKSVISSVSFKFWNFKSNHNQSIDKDSIVLDNWRKKLKFKTWTFRSSSGTRIATEDSVQVSIDAVHQSIDVHPMSESDDFYEKSFEAIENFKDPDWSYRDSILLVDYDAIVPPWTSHNFCR